MNIKLNLIQGSAITITYLIMAYNLGVILPFSSCAL